MELVADVHKYSSDKPKIKSHARVPDAKIMSSSKKMAHAIDVPILC